MNKKKLKNFIKIFLSFCLAGICFATVVIIYNISRPTTSEGFDASPFTKNIASAQQILELWHVETFEGGSGSRGVWLEKRAAQFEKQNKGIFIMVKTLSLDEFINKINAQEFPDLISFGSGIGVNLADKLLPLKDYSGVKENLAKSGKFNGESLAAAYMFSGYALISQTSRIESSPLINALFSSGEVIKGRKRNTNIYSCVFGAAGLTSAQSAINLNLANLPLAVYPETQNLTNYEAYCQFLLGKAKILVATMRDVARIENRIITGEIDDAVIEAFTNWTDMISYIAIPKTINADKLGNAELFIDYIMSKNVQTKVADIGLFPAIGKGYSSGVYKALEEYYSNVTCPYLFA